MPAPTKPDRRFSFALTSAVAATTIAVGVTAATLLGWLRPPEPGATVAPPAAEPSVVYVPIASTSPPDPPAAAAASGPSERVAMDEPREHEGAEREHEREDDDD